MMFFYSLFNWCNLFTFCFLYCVFFVLVIVVIIFEYCFFIFVSDVCFFWFYCSRLFLKKGLLCSGGGCSGEFDVLFLGFSLSIGKIMKDEVACFFSLHNRLI